jgi:hypothetical protein
MYNQGSYIAQNLTYNWTDFDGAYTLQLDVKRYGYGYGQRSPTAHFALLIIYIYLGLIVSYLLYASFDQLSRRHPWSVKSWGSLEEMIALAVNTMPSKSSPILVPA